VSPVESRVRRATRKQQGSQLHAKLIRPRAESFATLPKNPFGALRVAGLDRQMLQTAKRAGDQAAAKAAPNDRYLEAFRWMLLTRVFEEKLTSLYRGGMVSGGVYVGRGQEAVSVAGGMFLQKSDIFAPLIRDQAGRVAVGA
jgi:hypothetical protein